VTLLLAVAVSAFGLVLAGSIDAGQRQAALLDTGADYRVESTVPNGALPAGLDLASIPGVEAATQVAVLTGVTARASSTIPDRITLVIVEPAAYARVTAGSALEASYGGQTGTLTGMEGDAAPVLVSTLWAGQRNIGPGVAIEATI